MRACIKYTLWEHTCRKWGRIRPTCSKPQSNQAIVKPPNSTSRPFALAFRPCISPFLRSVVPLPPLFLWWESTEEKRGGSLPAWTAPSLQPLRPPPSPEALRPTSRSSALPFRLLPPLALVCCVGRKLEVSGRIIGREKRETDRKVGNGSEGTRLLSTTVRVPHDRGRMGRDTRAT